MVQLRQVEAAGAAGDAAALHNALDEVVLPQRLGDLAPQPVDLLRHLLQLLQHPAQRPDVHSRLPPYALQHGCVPVQLFEYLGLDIGAGGDAQNVQNTADGGTG